MARKKNKNNNNKIVTPTRRSKRISELNKKKMANTDIDCPDPLNNETEIDEVKTQRQTKRRRLADVDTDEDRRISTDLISQPSLEDKLTDVDQPHHEQNMAKNDNKKETTIPSDNIPSDNVAPVEDKKDETTFSYLGHITKIIKSLPFKAATFPF